MNNIEEIIINIVKPEDIESEKMCDKLVKELSNLITKSNEEAENRGWQLGFKKGYDEGLSNGRSLPISMTEAVALSGKQLLDIQYFKKQILEEFADILERKGWGDMTVEIETYLTQKENKDE